VVDFAVRVLINAIALLVAVYLVPGIRAPDELWQLLVVAAIFGAINAYLRPIVKLLSLPLTLLAFGVVGFVINTGLLLLLALLSGELALGFRIAGWPGGPFDLDVIVAAFLASLVISVVSTVLALARKIVPGV